MSEEKTKVIVKKKPSQETAIMQRPAIAHMPKMDDLMALGKALAKSKMFPDCEDEFAAVAKIEYGRELGLKPVISLQIIHVIKGRLGIESKALLALAKENGIKVEVLQKDKKGCKLKFSRGEESHTDSFTEEDAKRANLLYKDNWKTFPEEMYSWRCVAKGLRFFDPGLALGLYTTEELVEFADEPPEVKLAQKLKEVDEAEVEEIKVEAKDEIKDAEVVTEEDEKVEKQIAKEEKPEKKKAKPRPEVKEVTPEQPQPEPEPQVKEVTSKEPPEEPEPTVGDEQRSEVWRLFNLLVDKFGRDPGDLDKKLRERFEKGKKVRIPEDFTPEEADLLITILKNSVENEEKKLVV